MTAAPEEDAFTALESATFPRVDLVSAAANGTRFFIAKQDGAAGLLNPEFVRDLIAKSEPELSGRGQVTMPNGITLTGSPGQIAAFIHEAATRRAEVAKAEMSTKSINDLDDDQFAYIEPGKKDESGRTVPRSLRHFPLNDEAHVRNALSRAPQSPFGDKAMPKIRAAAKRFKIDVAKEAGVQNVAKDMGPELDDGVDGLDPTVPLAAPEEMAPGDPTDPGSPAWESIDAATARKWLSIAARLENALCVLAEREMLEAASADPDDAENAWNLEDAKCAIEYAIGQLAVFAAGEQAEAELGAEMEAVGKALAGSAPALDVIEGLTAVRKAGRVLSASNEAAIRGAVESLQKVLASLPEAPVAKQAGSKEGAMPGTAGAAPAQAVAKETPSPEAQAADTGPVNAGGTTGLGEPRQTGPAASLPADGPQQALPGDVPGRQVIKAAAGLKVVVYDRAGHQCITDPAALREPVVKADDGGDGKPRMQAVFDQDGDLIGVVDPDAITPVAGASAPPAGNGDGMEDDGADDMTPQPPADAGTPASDVTPDGQVAKSGNENTTITLDVLKSIIGEAVAEHLGALHPGEDVAKSADVTGLGAEVELLKARLAVVEETPAAPRVFANGAVPPRGNGPVPPAHQMRGQDQGAAPLIDVAKAREMKQRMYTADPAEANRIATELNQSAIATLEAIHGTRR